MKIVVPIPAVSLWPNSRVHWRVKAIATKRYREFAWARAVGAMREAGMFPPRWERASVKLTAHFKTSRRRDSDNLIAAAKALFDGLADAGIVANDCGFTHLPPEMRVDKLNPRIEVEITEV